VFRHHRAEPAKKNKKKVDVNNSPARERKKKKGKVRQPSRPAAAHPILSRTLNLPKEIKKYSTHFL
jgi:hypothetical protein